MRSKIGFACVIILKRKRTISKDIIDPIYLLLYRCEVRKSIGWHDVVHGTRLEFRRILKLKHCSPCSLSTLAIQPTLNCV